MLSGSALSQNGLSGNSSTQVVVAGRAVLNIGARAAMKVDREAAGTARLEFAAGTGNFSKLNTFSAKGAITALAHLPELEITKQISARAVVAFQGRANFNNPTFTRVNKSYFYKIFDNGTYVSTLKPAEVSSDFEIKQDINSAGSEVTFTLKRDAADFGAGYDIKLGNTVEVYVTDQEAPNGLKIFTGYINDYEADWLTNDVKVVLRGFGDELADWIIEAGESLADSQPVQNDEIMFGNSQFSSAIEHMFTTKNAAYEMSRLRYRLRGVSYIYGGDPKGGGGQQIDVTGQTITARVYPTEADLRANTNVLRTATAQIDSIEYKEYSFDFGSPLEVEGNTAYYVRITSNNMYTGATEPGTTFIAAVDGNSIADEAAYVYSINGGGWNAIAKEIWYEAYQTTGSTQAVYNSYDPSDILRALIDDYHSRGGTLNYTEDSIDDTNSVVSYTFNTNTLLEGVQKVLELAPEGWYWYIDQATNTIHFHQKAEEPDHIFVIGRHITKLSTKTSATPIVNQIYFVGGNEFYKKYTLPQSDSGYQKKKAIRLKDGRVSLEDTADIMANRSMQGQAGIYVTIGVGDNNITTSKGYDIESVQIGQMIRLAASGDTNQPRYDVARFDDAVYDYDPANVGTQVFQVVTKSYTPNELNMQVSNIGYDVNKRTSDIKRNLKDEQYADTPATPLT